MNLKQVIEFLWVIVAVSVTKYLTWSEMLFLYATIIYSLKIMYIYHQMNKIPVLTMNWGRDFS